MHQVYFIRENRKIEVPEGTTVLEAQRLAGLRPDAPCGGAGTCGKCRVVINGRNVQACRTNVREDLEVDTAPSSSFEDAVILTEGFSRPVAFCPGVSVHTIEFTKTVPGDKRSDWERMLQALEDAGVPDTEQFLPDPELSSSLYERCRQGGTWYIAHTDREILDICDEKRNFCLAAFDIGTTTLAGYLLDAANGQVLAVESRMNPQAQYGADVIMRADYALAHGTGELSGCIRRELNEMLGCLAGRAGRETADILQISVAGNTCMHHLFLGISPASLVHAPYTPAISRSMVFPAAQYGLTAHPKGQLLMLPNIAGYVGADTTGCLLAVRPDRKKEITLLLDIGTNGEMVLGNRDRMVACSTAAGPAFEGAKIQCGMRGAEGAIDHVHFENNQLVYSTIGDARPVGICGSGLMDIIAELLKAGIIASSGRLEKPESLTTEIGKANAHRLEKIDNFLSFVLADETESGTGKKIFLSQKDIREVQLAKSAMAAGIILMSDTLKIKQEDIKKIMIAGAFGNYMSPDSACAIGLLPQELRDRIEPIGNAAGEGSKIAALNKEEFHHCDQVARQTEFLELATHPDFQDCYVDELEFPEY